MQKNRAATALALGLALLVFGLVIVAPAATADHFGLCPPPQMGVHVGDTTFCCEEVEPGLWRCDRP